MIQRIWNKVALFLGVVLLFCGNAFAVDWPQLQSDHKRTGFISTNVDAPFSSKWSRDLGAVINGSVQPVIASSRVIIGTSNGTVYGINESTGVVSWSYSITTNYPPGGPINYTAAIMGGYVYVCCDDGYLYRLNATTGVFSWRTKVGRLPAGAAPLVYNDVIYVGSRDGYLYAYNTSGVQQWAFDTAITGKPRAAILSAPSISPANSKIFFSAENLVAYAINLSGTLQWSYQMYGDSVAYSTPVVSETNGIVHFTTKPLYSFHATLGLDDKDLFCPGDEGGACASCDSYDPTITAYNSPCDTVTLGGCATQWNEQHAATGSIDYILSTYPHRRTFYALKISDGTHVPVPILYQGGGGETGMAPVVNDTTGAVYVMARTKYSRRDAAYFCRKWVDIVRLAVTSADTYGTFHFIPCVSGYSCPASWDFHFIGDEGHPIAMAGHTLLNTGWYGTGSLRTDTGYARYVSVMTGSPEGIYGTCGYLCAPPAVANGVVFVHEPVSVGEPITAIVAYSGS